VADVGDCSFLGQVSGGGQIYGRHLLADGDLSPSVRRLSVCLSVPPCAYLYVCVCGYHISHACAVVQVRASSDIKHGEEDKLCR